MADQLANADLITIPISDQAEDILIELLEASDEAAFVGAAHPQDQDAILLRLERAEIAVRKLINRLEANQK